MAAKLPQVNIKKFFATRVRMGEVKGLDVELQRVRRLITSKMREINNDANSRGVLYSGAPIIRKIEEVPQIIEDEIKHLIPYFSRKKDLDKISVFIDEQKAVVYESSAFHGLKADKITPFDARVDELKGLIENKRRNVKIENRKQSFRFWVPVTISIFALVVSIVSLLITWSSNK